MRGGGGGRERGKKKVSSIKMRKTRGENERRGEGR